MEGGRGGGREREAIFGKLYMSLPIHRCIDPLRIDRVAI